MQSLSFAELKEAMDALDMAESPNEFMLSPDISKLFFRAVALLTLMDGEMTVRRENVSYTLTLKEKKIDKR